VREYWLSYGPDRSFLTKVHFLTDELQGNIACDIQKLRGWT